MKGAILRVLSSLNNKTRGVIITNNKKSSNFKHPLFQLTTYRSIRVRLLSSKSHETKTTQIDNRLEGSVDDVDGISDQEIKKRIEKFYEGDEEALPDIFEAILKRKLAGVQDDKFMDEIRQKHPTLYDDEDDSDSYKSSECNNDSERESESDDDV